MLSAVLDSPNMAKRIEPRKRAISVTLTAKNLDTLEAMAERMEFKPSLSQLLDKALTEFLERAQARKKGPKE
jgi:hypothetical protein